MIFNTIYNMNSSEIHTNIKRYFLQQTHTAYDIYTQTPLTTTNTSKETPREEVLDEVHTGQHVNDIDSEVGGGGCLVKFRMI